MAVKIRRAAGGDVPCLALMLKELFAIEDGFTADRVVQERGLGMLLHDAFRSVVLVAEDSCGISGMVTGQLVVSTAAGGYSVLLEDLYVVPSMRGCGVGSALVDELTVWGLNRGALRIQLVADSGNTRALDFYRSMGFSVSNMKGLYRPL